MGGFIASRQSVVDLMRQRARPYLFSNALTPALLGGAHKALEIARAGDALRAQLESNAARFRAGMTAAGFELSGQGHPIIPVMIGDASVATDMAERLLSRGIYVTAFSFPVVPRGTARIRTQMNAAHTSDDVDRAIDAFVADRHGVGLDRGVDMRALVKPTPGPGLVLADVPVPSPGVNDVLIRVTHAAICGTDLHIYNWDEWAARTLKPPLIVGSRIRRSGR